MADNGEIENYLICSEKYSESVIGFFKSWAFFMFSLLSTIINDAYFIVVAYFGGALIYQFFSERSARKDYLLKFKELNHIYKIREYMRNGR